MSTSIGTARPGSSHLLTALNGVPSFLGVIVATTTKNNNDTAAPFYNDLTNGPLLAGKVLMLQPDTACYVKFGSAATVTATGTDTGDSVYLAARQTLVLVMGESTKFIACVAASGTTNLRVWELT